MARVNVSYSEFTCDVCGEKERVTGGANIPDGWAELTLEIYNKIQVCSKCQSEITKFHKELIEKMSGEVDE